MGSGGQWRVGSRPVRASRSDPLSAPFLMKASWPQKGAQLLVRIHPLQDEEGEAWRRDGGESNEEENGPPGSGESPLPEMPPNSCSDQVRSGTADPRGAGKCRFLRKLCVLCYPAGRRGWVLTLRPSLCGPGSRTGPWPPSLWHPSTPSDLQGPPVAIGQVWVALAPWAHAQQRETLPGAILWTRDSRHLI